MTEKDLIIQNLRRENAHLKAERQRIETMIAILKTQVEELHQQIKRDRLAMSNHFRGEADNAKK